MAQRGHVNVGVQITLERGRYDWLENELLSAERAREKGQTYLAAKFNGEYGPPEKGLRVELRGEDERGRPLESWEAKATQLVGERFGEEWSVVVRTIEGPRGERVSRVFDLVESYDHAVQVAKERQKNLELGVEFERNQLESFSSPKIGREQKGKAVEQVLPQLQKRDDPELSF